jgi:membrane glycosyltransferase
LKQAAEEHLLGIYLLWDHALSQHDYFEADKLFPIWEIVKTWESISLFSITIALLVIPKLLAAIVVLCRPPLRKAYGGSISLLLSLVLEILFTMLIAPVMMVFHLLFVFSIFSGRLIGWNTQPRGNRGLTMAEALSCQKWQISCGVLIIAAVTLVAPQHLWWMLPIVSGLLLAAPLAVFSSRVDIGCRLRQLGLFVIPEESNPPMELRALRQTGDSADHPVAMGSDVSVAHSPIEPSYSASLSYPS